LLLLAAHVQVTIDESAEPPSAFQAPPEFGKVVPKGKILKIKRQRGTATAAGSATGAADW
jgi:hypothetical protein